MARWRRARRWYMGRGKARGADVIRWLIDGSGGGEVWDGFWVTDRPGLCGRGRISGSNVGPDFGFESGTAFGKLRYWKRGPKVVEVGPKITPVFRL